MIKLTKAAAALALGVALIAAGSPAFAQSRVYDRAGYDTRAPAVPGDMATGSNRAAAIRDCSAQGNKFPLSTWGDTQLDTYRACMAEHGQIE